MKRNESLKKSITNNDNKGFTLVELIVVLVILAILAAILVPALLGYIDSARDKQYMLNARNCMTAAQAQLIELYGQSGGTVAEGDYVIPGGSPTSAKNGDSDITKTEFAQKVLETADMVGDNTPYCFMIAVGSNCANNKSAAGAYTVTEHDKYTVYYGFYMETESAPPIYYYNGEWSKSNPRAQGTNKNTEIFSEYNVVKSGSLKGKRLQYYLISNKTKKGSVTSGGFWDWLKSMK